MENLHLQLLFDILLPSDTVHSGCSKKDIEDAERELQLQFPESYRELMLSLGAGMIDDYIMVLGPNAKEAFIRVQTRGPQECAATKEFLKKWEISTPEPLYPEPDGIFPWAYTIDGDLFFLSPVNDNWVGVFPRQSELWQTFACNVITFLYGILTTRIQVDCLPDDFVEEKHTFVPAD